MRNLPTEYRYFLDSSRLSRLREDRERLYCALTRVGCARNRQKQYAHIQDRRGSPPRRTPRPRPRIRRRCPHRPRTRHRLPHSPATAHDPAAAATGLDAAQATGNVEAASIPSRTGAHKTEHNTTRTTTDAATYRSQGSARRGAAASVTAGSLEYQTATA